MAKHTCEFSDHISSIAEKNGFKDWNTLWNDNGSMHARRANPNMLFKDPARWGNGVHDKSDVLDVPDPNAKPKPAATDAHHPHVILSNKLFLRLRILKGDFTAVANAEYTLTIDGAKAPFVGKTSALGQIEHEIPRAAQKGKLTVRVPPDHPLHPPPAGKGGSAALAGEIPVTWELAIGALDPILEHAPDAFCTYGVQQRLNNLAINTGVLNGDRTPAVAAAVKLFQRLFALKVDGIAGQRETQPKLRDVHDAPDSVLGPVPVKPPAKP